MQIKFKEKYLNKYGLDENVDKYYPFQLSGGMARKVLLSTALVSDKGYNRRLTNSWSR